jgi:protein-L-isoaspartate(D-aspartate) O-methyltransferase
MTKSMIDEAFEKTPRELFLPENMRPYTHEDRPIPIGYGQTNSQPSTVRKMLEWLDVGPDEKALDIGSGSGWTTALLSHLIGPKGRVLAVEIVPELVKIGRMNCKAADISNAEFFQADKALGFPAEAPFDRILVSASAKKLPDELVDQLAVGGRMVIPVGNDILEITKRVDEAIEIKTRTGFLFVPLIPLVDRDKFDIEN